MPTSVVFNYRDGKYAIDSNSKSGHPEKNILTWLVGQMCGNGEQNLI